MRITVYGTRGSYPVCRREVIRYGGNTTCWLLEAADDVIVIDGGSGIVNLGNDLVRRDPGGRLVHLCMTHPHWDHVMGLPFFGPFFTPGFEVQVHGADSEAKRLERVLATQYKPQSFPVAFEHLAASIEFDRIEPGNEGTLGSVKLSCLKLNHPGVDLGYRFESDEGCFVMLTDLAPIENNLLGAGMKEAADGRQEAFEKDYMSALVEFCRGADLVSHDTNFTDDEIVGREHWGHSTPNQALDLLSNLDTPPSLMLAHHDPDHLDDDMDRIYQQAQSAGEKRGIEVLVAKEGSSLEL